MCNYIYNICINGFEWSFRDQMWMFIGFKYFKWDKMCVEKRDSTGISPSSANHQPIIIGPKTQWMDVSGSPFQIPGLVDGKWRF